MSLIVCHPPPPLKPGDLLRVVSPSGALREFETFQKGVEMWRSHGYHVSIYPGYDSQWGYLAGTDEHRRFQLKAALLDPDCRGILCARGGYGGARLLENWDWTPTTPKWLIGFSDITSLLWSLSLQGVSGVHGPLLTTLADEPNWSIQRLFDWVTHQPLPSLYGTGWGSGMAIGRLLPANLTVATHILGTTHQPDLNGVILAFEDVSEAPYRIDRMLTQWRMSGALMSVAGIALGRFSRCSPPANIPSLTVEEVLRDRLSGLQIPIVSDLPFGHDGPNAALPVGMPVQLDADLGSLDFIESAL
ncbi:MAG: S66 peptidase family protein [Elainellaceae cyanobacterium]